MAKIKTVTGGRIQSFIGSIRVLSETDGLLQKVEVLLLNSEVNRNGWKYLNLDEHRKLFANTPILVAYKGDKVGDGHNFDEVRNPDGTVTASFMSATAERIVGWFRDERDIRLETIGNIEWIVGTGYIWKWYAQELVAKLRGQGRGRSEMSVSIETLVDEMHKEGDVEAYTAYEILGTTILGDDVAPAVKDASIRALSAIGTAGIRELTLRVASANPQPKDEDGKDAEKPTNKKGTSNMNRPIKQIEPKFPGYRVLAVCNGYVALCTEEGDFFHSSYTEENGEIIPGAKVAMDAVCTLGEGDAAVTFDLNAIRADDRAKIADLTEKLNAEELKAKNANETLDAMKKRENARREKAVRDAIKARFEKVRENTEAALDETVCATLTTDEKIAEYAKMENAEGEFCGDIQACRDVDALCMDKVIEASEKRRENAAHRFAFDVNNPDEGADEFDKLIEGMVN